MRPKYEIPESMAKVGSKAEWYTELRREYDTSVLPKDDARSLKFVVDERGRHGVATGQSTDARTTYDVMDCPDNPPPRISHAVFCIGRVAQLANGRDIPPDRRDLPGIVRLRPPDGVG